MIIAEEKYGSSPEKHRQIFKIDQNRFFDQKESVYHWSSLSSLTKNIFLPKGYPESVSEDYLHYQLWDSIQAFCSSITGALSTQAILQGSGIGDASATVVGATVTWLIKDGCGHVGRIIFAWQQGTELDCHCKKWRLFADILNDLAIFLELISPNFPEFFTAIVCTSSVMKSVVGVAGGATRAAMTQHQARRKNLADVSAKDGSQETVVNLSALICSLILIPALSGKAVLIWTLFSIFTFLHILANYLAVHALKMETFNFERYKIIAHHYLHTNGQILSVALANKEESVWLRIWPRKVTIKLGAEFRDAVRTPSEFDFLEYLYSGSNYLLNVKSTSQKGIRIVIVLHKNSNVHTQMKAMFQAFVLYDVLTSKHKVSEINKELHEMINQNNVPKLLELSKNLTDKLFEPFLVKLPEHGWETNFTLLGADEWRAKWGNVSL